MKQNTQKAVHDLWKVLSAAAQVNGNGCKITQLVLAVDRQTPSCSLACATVSLH